MPLEALGGSLKIFKRRIAALVVIQLKNEISEVRNVNA